MVRSIPLWLREMLKTWLQYISVGFGFVLSGVLFVFLRIRLGQNTALVISLGIGVLLAKLVWDALDKRIVLHGPDRSQASSANIRLAMQSQMPSTVVQVFGAPWEALSGSERRQGTQQVAQIAAQIAGVVGGTTLLGAQPGPHLF